MSKQLSLIIKEEYFLEILNGEKTTEYRSFSEFYISRLCDLAKDGEIDSVKEFDTVIFYLGYAKDRPQMIVECKGVFIEHEEEIELLTPENCEFAIDLGEIIEEKNCEVFTV